MFTPGIELVQRFNKYYILNPSVGIQVEINQLGYQITAELKEMSSDVVDYEYFHENYGLNRDELDAYLLELCGLCIYDTGSNDNNWTVEWDLTYRCNLRCRHCMVSAGNPLANELSTSQAIELMNELKQNGFKILVISGGEPFVHTDIMRIINHASELGFYIKLLTNACLITEQTAEQLAHTRVIYCQISLDGPDAKTHDSIRGEGSYELMLSGARCLKKAGINYGMAMVLTSSNAHLIEDTVNVAINTGANSFTTGPVVLTGRAKQNNLNPPEDINIEKTIYTLAMKYNNLINFNCYLVALQKQRKMVRTGYANNSCTRITQGIAIGPSGAISFCKGFFGKCDLAASDIGDNQYILGTYPTDTISSVISKKSTYSFDVGVKSKDCIVCGYQEDCMGGCPAEVFLKHGDFIIPEGKCKLKSKFEMINGILNRL